MPTLEEDYSRISKWKNLLGGQILGVEQVEKN